MTMNVALEDVDGNIYASADFMINSNEWKKYELTLSPNKTDYCGRLVVTAKNTGKLYLDMVSLFPEKTFKGHGLRADLCELLADLKPKFMRFPGGCLIHDGSLNKDDRNSTYRWKNTIGKIQDRAARRNNWGYNQSLGLGYYEYFILCEDLGAKPIPILPAGYNPHSGQGVAIDDLGEWIDDALDLIEFANGGVDTVWGKKRADLGHPKPFGLEYIGIGNEEVGQEFFDRYTYFHKVIKAKYPEIKIINSSGPFAAGTEYERGWKSARDNGSDLVDEHYYTAPEWFLANCHRYDSFSKKGPKVFLGEYATWGNTYYNALVEAAYMTHLERNAGVVSLACYAPLFANTDYVNWKPDMIWFNNHQSYGSANYYVQKMFMNNQGTHLLKTNIEGFEKTTVLGSPIISGDVMLQAENGVTAEFTDISITIDGKTKSYDDIFATNETVYLDTIDAQDYTISLKAKKISGPQGFRIKFGKTDDKNFIDWTVGGWANGDCQIESNINGRTSGIKHKVFSVAAGVVYDLKLEVRGRVITIYINGEKQFTAEDKQAVIEEIYCTSSIDEETGETIIKAVNVRDEAVKTTVKLTDKASVSGTIFEISDCELDAENSFENPKKVSPSERAFSADGEFEYEFPKQSITVFRLK
jgi:alpha-L-arabinofuranosidase